MNPQPLEPQKTKGACPVLPFLITFCLMFIVWVVLSGNFSVLMLGFGVVSSILVAAFAKDLLFPGNKVGSLAVFFRFIIYIPWLLLEILKANLHLLKLVFDPAMMEKIDPHLIDFPTKLTSDMSKVTLANSITLTPGTITVKVTSEGNFKVHAIDKPSADALPGDMLEKAAKIFGEPV